jgi:hypothetical protein
MPVINNNNSNEVSEAQVVQEDLDTPGACDTAQIIIEITDTSKGFSIKLGASSLSKPTHALAIMVNHLNSMIEQMLGSQGVKQVDSDSKE